MNVSQAKQVPVEQVLYRMGVSPIKNSGFDVWYKSPFREEKTPSFKVNTKINRWYDHGEGFGGNTIDLVIKKSGCTVSEALQYLKDFDVFFSFQQQQIIEENTKKEYEFLLVKNVEHKALTDYLQSRKILNAFSELKEVHYRINDKNYFGIGFQNNSNGFEIRSKYAKMCLGKKDITTILNSSITLRVFEGFFDFLSWKQIENELSDYMILNSINLLKKNIRVFTEYEKIELFLDNDLQGDKATELIKNQFKNVIDCRSLYKCHKDLNEFLTQRADTN